MAGLKISTGAITLDIERDGEAIGSIRFNPEDIKFREAVLTMMTEVPIKRKEIEQRAQELDSRTDKIIIDGVEINENISDSILLWKDFYSYFHGKIDDVFGSGTSETVFGGAYTVDSMLDFFNGVKPYIEEASKKKISKYVGQ